jgi:hypothetical protein
MDNFQTALICILASLIMGIFIALIVLYLNMPPQYMYQQPQTKQVATESKQIESYNVELNNDGAISLYDHQKAFNPFEDPTRRVPRHELPPLYLKNLLNYPTRGYPDAYTQIGILIREGNNKEGDNNKILRLFGRQEFPGSNNYQYYTAINSGNDNIKIPLNRRKMELYDDDSVFVKPLNDHYKVELYKYDMPRYYPDLF